MVLWFCLVVVRSLFVHRCAILHKTLLVQSQRVICLCCVGSDDWLACADKSLFERPPELYGAFGEAARRATREDQYPETGRFGEYTGARWREVFDYNGVLPEESVDHGMKNICPRAGDVLIMPEALTHGVLPWLPTDRARYAMLMTITPSDRGKHSTHALVLWTPAHNHLTSFTIAD